VAILCTFPSVGWVKYDVLLFIIAYATFLFCYSIYVFTYLCFLLCFSVNFLVLVCVLAFSCCLSVSCCYLLSISCSVLNIGLLASMALSFMCKLFLYNLCI
jgi:hypothetical protein